MKEKDSENWVLRWGWGWGVCGIHLRKGKGFTKCGVKGGWGGGVFAVHLHENMKERDSENVLKGSSCRFIYMKT